MNLNKKYSILSAVAVAVLVGLASVGLQADDKKGRVCKADVERLCGSIEKGEGRIRKCMKEKKDQLSAECRAKIEERMAFRQKMRDACKEDKKKFCKGKKRKEARQCMIENKAQLSANCQAVMSEAQAKWEKRKGKK